jgi:hypothetical protein
MANYPIKLLKDETNAAFVPLVSTDCIRDKNNQTLQQILDKKLSPTNLLPGEHVSITTEDNNCYVNVDLPAGLTLIDNLNTTTSNQGSLDAHQGKVLKDMIPEIIDDITDTSPTKGLSANQGYILNQKFNDYLPLHGTADKAATVGNLVVRSKSMWGTLTESNGYTVVNAWDSPADGGIALSDKDNRLSVQIDGLFYQNEGRYRCLDTSDLPYDSGWISVTTWQNGAGNWDNEANPVQYRKIGNIVYFQGLMKCGSSGVQFTIPEGFRPNNKSYNCWICRCGTSTCRIHVNYSGILGNVAIEGNSSSGLEVPLSPISYIAGA